MGLKILGEIVDIDAIPSVESDLDVNSWSVVFSIVEEPFFSWKSEEVTKVVGNVIIEVNVSSFIRVVFNSSLRALVTESMQELRLTNKYNDNTIDKILFDCNMF